MQHSLCSSVSLGQGGGIHAHIGAYAVLNFLPAAVAAAAATGDDESDEGVITVKRKLAHSKQAAAAAAAAKEASRASGSDKEGPSRGVKVRGRS